MSSAGKQVMDELFGSDEEEDSEVTPTQDCSTVQTATDFSTLSSHRPKSNGVASFHNGTEEAMWIYVQQHAREGDAQSILATMDRFCYERHWMMHMGDRKRQVVLEALHDAMREKKDSFNLVELGSYCGYSAVALGKELDVSSQQHMYCIENHPLCVKWTQQLIAYAHLTDRITVIHAPANACGEWKAQLGGHGKIDFLFIDHDKKSYHLDLQHIEEEKLLQPGATVVADNVLCFNSPLTEYLSHVRNPAGPYESSILHEGYLEYTTEEEQLNDSGTKDGIEVSVYRG